ncbi:DUF418 domain-containing protein [Macrococcus carouselicus]|uniref:DUF418 domain-containing protein n=1 Tax=Macrococcus carouselicus TaxID=69969 RepID=A0A9Q8CM11_9STAP|nr:DUF418 domain-containing protein [Macrococcus carouselicus]TDM02393.1 DUF418 domain-containing protein [Macrococcus carouselicus]
MKRLTVVDSLRGFSLMGILFANLLLFQFGHYGANYPEFYGIDAANKLFIYWVKIFIEGSFMPIFAVLFGFGLMKMSESLEKKGRPVKRAIIRRGLILFTMGMLHSAYLFSGDILYLYGTVTFIVVWVLKFKIRSLIIIAALVIPLIVGILLVNPDFMFAAEQSFATGGLTAEQSEYLAAERGIFSTGTLQERKDFFMEEDPFMAFTDEEFLLLIPIAILFNIPLFLIGMILAKNRFFETGLTFVKKNFIYLTPIFILFKACMVIWPDNDILGTLGIISVYLLIFSYISLFYALYQRWQALKLFEAIGRLSLTNYIAQSVFHSFIYYGYGMQRFGDDNFLLSLLIATLFFILQVALSNLYFKYFKQGPLEYIARVVTYWSFSPNKKTDNKLV